MVHGPHGLARPLCAGVSSFSPQLNSVVCPETQKRTEALDCYPLSGAANQHYELDCESLFPVPAGEVRNTLQERQQEERGVLKKQPCPSHSPDRHWGGEQKIPRWPFSNPFPLAEKLVRPTRQTQPTNPSIHPPQPRREFGLRAAWPHNGGSVYLATANLGRKHLSRGEAVPLRRN